MPTMADEIRAKLASGRQPQGLSMADQIRAKLRPPTARPFAPDSGWASQTSPVAPMVDPRQLTDLPVNLPQTTAVDGSFDPRPKYATLNPQDNAARIGERQFSAGENLAAIPAGLAAGALYGMGEPGTTSLAGKFLTPHLQAPTATPSQFVGTMLPYVAGSAGLTRAIPALANQAITGATQGARFIEGAANIGRGLATDAAVSAGVEGLRQAASGEFDPAELARQALLYPALGAGIGIPMQVGAAKRAGAAIGAEQAAQSEFFERAARQAEAGGGTPAYRETGEIRPWEQYDLPPLAREQSDPRFQLIARRMADARDKARLQGIQLSRQQEAAAFDAAEREAAAMSQEQARQELLKHRLQVNQNARAQRGGVQPVLPEPGYRLPQTPGTARRSAEVLENAPFQQSERLGLPAPPERLALPFNQEQRGDGWVSSIEPQVTPEFVPPVGNQFDDVRDRGRMVRLQAKPTEPTPTAPKPEPAASFGVERLSRAKRKELKESTRDRLDVDLSARTPLTNYIGNKKSIYKSGGFEGMLPERKDNLHFTEGFAGSGITPDLLGVPGANRTFNDLNHLNVNFQKSVQKFPDRVKNEGRRLINMFHDINRRITDRVQKHAEILRTWQREVVDLANQESPEGAAAYAIINGKRGRRGGKFTKTTGRYTGSQGFMAGPDNSGNPYKYLGLPSDFDVFARQIDTWGESIKGMNITQEDAREVLRKATQRVNGKHNIAYLDPPYPDTQDYGIGTDLSTPKGAVKFVDEDVRNADLRGIPILYSNTADGAGGQAVVAKLRELGFNMKFVPVTDGGGGVRNEVVAWNYRGGADDIPEVLHGQKRQDWLRQNNGVSPYSSRGGEADRSGIGKQPRMDGSVPDNPIQRLAPRGQESPSEAFGGTGRGVSPTQQIADKINAVDQSVGVNKMVETPPVAKNATADVAPKVEATTVGESAFSKVKHSEIPKSFQVEIDVPSAKTGKIRKVKANAREAYESASQIADQHKALLACLRGK